MSNFAIRNTLEYPECTAITFVAIYTRSCRNETINSSNIGNDNRGSIRSDIVGLIGIAFDTRVGQPSLFHSNNAHEQEMYIINTMRTLLFSV